MNRKLILVVAVLFAARCLVGSVKAEDDDIVKEMENAQKVLSQPVKTSVQVVDEEGHPISGAEISASFQKLKTPGMGWGFNEICKKFSTDEKGIAVIAGKSENAIGLVASKDGYYDTFGISIEPSETGWVVTGQTNLIAQIILKKKINPIAMYAKKVDELSGKVSDTLIKGEPVGYDLVVGDWVKPCGKGEVSDFIFNLQCARGGITKNRHPIYDATFTVSFSNEADGIQSVFADPNKGSALRLPRIGQENNYLNGLRKIAGRDVNGFHGDKDRSDQNYFFRVRTKKDAAGKIISTLYGKVHGEIKWRYDGKIRFTYYLNPTPNDRNMEFNPKKNIFKKLTSLEEVFAP